MEDGEFTPNYAPSPDLTELGPIISEIGTFHDRPTYSSVDPPLTHHWYGMPEDDATILNPRALVMVVMVCLVFTHMIWHFMSNLSLNLSLCLGEVSFLTMRRGLGALITLHLPS